MTNREEIDKQREFLVKHRQILAHYLRQQAILGANIVPTAVIEGISDSRTAISRIKQTLRSFGVDVADHPEEMISNAKEERISRSDALDDKERSNLREVMRAYQRRLRVLELQRATKGVNTPPEVLTEIEDIQSEIEKIEEQATRLSPILDRVAQRQRRSEAIASFFSRNWELAEELLEQVVQVNPEDHDAALKLQQAQRQLDQRAAYQALRKLRSDGLWQATLDALDDFFREYPDVSDPDDLRSWAEFRKLRSERYDLVVAAIQEVMAIDRGDEVARSMLAQARAQFEEGQ
jgi:tetratricopeptide (TPR) repeat protein